MANDGLFEQWPRIDASTRVFRTPDKPLWVLPCRDHRSLCFSAQSTELALDLHIYVETRARPRLLGRGFGPD